MSAYYVAYAQIVSWEQEGWGVFIMPGKAWDSYGYAMEGVYRLGEVYLADPSPEWLAQAGLAACEQAKEEAIVKHQEALAKIAEQESKYLLLTTE